MTHFDFLTRFYDEGHIERLRFNEQRVLLAYARAMNTDGIAWPSIEKIATKLGHVSDSHAVKARTALRKMGYLEKVPRTDSRGVYRVTLPHHCEERTLPKTQGADSEPGTLPNRTGKPCGSRSPKQDKKQDMKQDEPMTETSVDTSPVVLRFPCKDNQTYELQQSQIDAWTEAYVGADVRGQCQAALDWAISNSSRRKSHRGMRTFLSSWIARSTNSTKNAGHGRAADKPWSARASVQHAFKPMVRRDK